MALLALLTTLAIGGGGEIACTFAGETLRDPVVSVRLEPVPSLKDRPGLYRVMFELGGARVRANAQPIDATKAADVMIRARAGAETFYTIGLRADGAAALNVTRDGAARMLIGRCEDHEPWVRGWLVGAEAR